MSISMSFEAKRNEPLNEQENARCAAIVDRYYTEYPFNKEYENFMVLTADLEPDVVYYSFTTFPLEEDQDTETSFAIANYWLKCLTEVTYALPDCQCSASFEDVEFILDPDKGWRFLTQKEYEERYGDSIEGL